MTCRIICCNPSGSSATAVLADAFVAGLEEAGHRASLSDLYAEGFNPVLSADEYRREAFYDASMPLLPDVLAHQDALTAADGLTFVFPLFWTDVPALLKGWFDRVWTWGFAYGSAGQGAAGRSMKVLERALFLCSAGNPLSLLEESGKLAALRAIWLDDRIFDRARVKDLAIFDETSRENPKREEKLVSHCAKAHELGRTFFD